MYGYCYGGGGKILVVGDWGDSRCQLVYRGPVF
jgi:hypothetical protein